MKNCEPLVFGPRDGMRIDAVMELWYPTKGNRIDNNK